MIRIFAELPLDGEAVQRIGGKDLCTILDLTSGALTDLKKRGIAVHLGHDSYDLEATVRGYVQHLRGMAAQWGTPDQAGQLTNERARLAKEQADAQALKNGKLRGELVDAGEVERAWGDVLRQVRARILAVPARVRAELPQIEAPAIDAFDHALRDALTEVGNADT